MFIFTVHDFFFCNSFLNHFDSSNMALVPIICSLKRGLFLFVFNLVSILLISLVLFNRFSFMRCKSLKSVSSVFLKTFGGTVINSRIETEFSGALLVFLTCLIDIDILWTAFQLVSLEVSLVFPLR